MHTLQSSSRDSFIYYGDRAGWSIALSQHRDSDALDRSNFAIVSEDVLSVPDSDNPDGLSDAAIERFSNWAVGWTESLIVRPGSSAAIRAQEWLDKLADYPVANEEHLSQIEWNEEWCLRCDRGTRAAHDGKRMYDDCGKFRSEEDAREIADRWRWRHTT